MIDYEELLDNSTKAVIQKPEDLGLCLVTGAAGFLGKNIVKALLEQGCRVRALINRTPLGFIHHNLEVFTGSVTDRDAMEKACEGVETIFHSAAVIAIMGGAFTRKSYYDQAYDANVIGTKNLLAAAVSNGSKRFIHTSSVDVAFDYSDQPNMQESAAYSQNPRSVYQKTKILAEKDVLEANGKNGLYTCAIRPGGIYGPEKNEMLDRFVEQLVSGKLIMCIGHPSIETGETYIGSLVHSELLAALHLGDNGKTKGSANGQAYFINDGQPMNPFEFFRDLIEGMGYKKPKIYLPAAIVLPFLYIAEFIVFKFNLNEPPLCPHAIKKIACTHWGSIEKAQNEIGYNPLKTVKEALAECLDYCKTLQVAAKK